jgi:ribosomal protein L37AE/L43A
MAGSQCIALIVLESGIAIRFASITGGFMIKPRKPPPISAIDRPRCPKCHMKMALARITPGSPGFEVRSFECPECEHAIAQRVAADPLESAKGWLAGELRPPKR